MHKRGGLRAMPRQLKNDVYRRKRHKSRKTPALLHENRGQKRREQRKAAKGRKRRQGRRREKRKGKTENAKESKKTKTEKQGRAGRKRRKRKKPASVRACRGGGRDPVAGSSERFNSGRRFLHSGRFHSRSCVAAVRFYSAGSGCSSGANIR